MISRVARCMPSRMSRRQTSRDRTGFPTDLGERPRSSSLGRDSVFLPSGLLVVIKRRQRHIQFFTVVADATKAVLQLWRCIDLARRGFEALSGFLKYCIPTPPPRCRIGRIGQQAAPRNPLPSSGSIPTLLLHASNTGISTPSATNSRTVAGWRYEFTKFTKPKESVTLFRIGAAAFGIGKRTKRPADQIAWDKPGSN